MSKHTKLDKRINKLMSRVKKGDTIRKSTKTPGLRAKIRVAKPKGIKAIKMPVVKMKRIKVPKK